jgi:hypothetical protein
VHHHEAPPRQIVHAAFGYTDRGSLRELSADLSAFIAAVGDPGERDETAPTWQRSDRAAVVQQAFVTGDSERGKAAPSGVAASGQQAETHTT